MKNSAKQWRDATHAIHSGEARHGGNLPVGVSIVRTSNFTFANTEDMKRWAEGRSKSYIYTRYGNPTLTVAEEKLAALEGGEAGLVTASGMAAISSALLGQLSAGEREFLNLLAKGYLYKEIADRMGISTHTVRYYVRTVYEKLHVHSRTEAVVKFLRGAG